MRFKQLLHPEIVLQKRGLPEARDFYAKGMKFVSISEFNPGGERKVSYEFDGTQVKTLEDREILYLLRADNVYCQHVCLVKKFVQDKAKIYHFSKALVEDLSQMDKEVPLELLPQNFLGYISFPPETIRDETGWIEGGYVSIAPMGEGIDKMANVPGLEGADRVIWISYLVKADREGSVGEIAGMLMPLTSTRISKLSADSTDFFKDSTSVRSHLRWQRCGPGLSEIELTPVKAHKRRLKIKD